MGHRLYQGASYFAFGALHPLWALHPKLKDGRRERWGYYAQPDLKKKSGPTIWFHGASAGDVLGLEPLIDAMRERFPQASVAVSVMTNSGHAMAQKLDIDRLLYAPYDLPGATQRAVAHLQPNLLVLEYTELWPNLIWAAHKAGVRIALSNGRIHEDREDRYRQMFRVFGSPLDRMDLFLMRSEVERERLLRLGAPRAKVHVTGDTKFDRLSRPADPAVVESLASTLGEGLLWVAGSTHQDEEKMLLRAYQRVVKTQPALRFLIAPRYLERCEDILRAARGLGFVATTRDDPHANKAQVVVLNSMGELASVYALADIALVGGGFSSRGGQNILEPARHAKVVLFGPHMENFRESVDLLYGRGGIAVQSEDHIVDVLSELLAQPEERERLGKMALQAVLGAQGAAARNADLLSRLL